MKNRLKKHYKIVKVRQLTKQAERDLNHKGQTFNYYYDPPIKYKGTTYRGYKHYYPEVPLE